MATTSLRAYGASHPGRDRGNNEDRLYFNAALGVFIVVDGMGGHAAGERAADTAVAALRARLESTGRAPAERLREAFTHANNEIHRLAATAAVTAGMAAVATAAVVAGGRVTVGHVGDTRGYRIRLGSLRKITRDHSPVGEREDRGEITEQEAMRHPRRHEVFRDLGSEPRDPADSDFVEIAEFPFEDDTALLLCSDGLTDLVPSDVILRMVRQHAGDGATVVERLVDAANAAGGRDNVTVVYVEGPAFAASVPHWDAGPDAATGPHRLPEPRRGGRLSSRLALAGVGLAAGVIAAAVALTTSGAVRDALLTLVPRPSPWTRTWTVGAGAAADGPTITGVLARARDGDTVLVEPGVYRERLVVDRAVQLVSARPHEAVVTAPDGAEAGWVAVEIRPGGAGRVSGFTIDGDDERPMSVGIRLADANARVEHIEVRGTRRAAIEVARGAGGTISACYLHDNRGVGLLIEDEATPEVRHNVITLNGAGLAREARGGQPGGRGASATGVAGSGRPVAASRPGTGEGTGIVAAGSARPRLFGNIVVRNAGGELAGFDVDELTDVVRDNIVEPPGQPAAPAPARGARGGRGPAAPAPLR